jgi:hypothetical protein
MKHEITKLENPSIRDEESIARVVGPGRPKEWRYLTERITCKIEDVLLQRE